MKYNWSTTEAWGKTSAALLASTALYLAFCVACVTGMPVEQDVGLALGILGGFPLWVGTACYAALARTAARAWYIPLGVALILAAWSTLALSLQ